MSTQLAYTLQFLHNQTLGNPEYLMHLMFLILKNGIHFLSLCIFFYINAVHNNLIKIDVINELGQR